MKKILQILLAFTGVISFSQTISSGKWSDLFSYNNVLSIREDNGRLIAATENGIFYYNPTTGEISKLSKANGLHEVKISAFDYNPGTKIGLVGYKNGSLDLITPDGITFVVDIPLATGYSGNKKINHISITGNQAVISTGYGVSIYNLDKKGFGDTAFFRTNGVYEACNEAVIKDNIVYAATNTGLKSHELNVTFPIYSSWNLLLSGAYTQIDSKGSNVIASTATKVQVGNGSTFTPISTTFTTIKDIVLSSQKIIVANQNIASLYNIDGTLVRTFDAGEVINTSTLFSDKLYTGTQFSGMFDENKKSYKPDGPYTNTSYKINLVKDKILVSSGARDGRYNSPVIDVRNLGFYYYNGLEWIYPSYFKNNTTKFNVLDAVSSPIDDNEIHFANYSQRAGQGIYKMKYNSSSKDFDFVKYFDTEPIKAFNRPVGFAYDNLNNILVSFSFYNDQASGGVGYAMYDKTTDDFVKKYFRASSQASQKPIYYEGLYWIPMPRQNCFLVFDNNGTVTDYSDDKIYFLTVKNGLPSNSFGSLSVAIDKSGDAWIGTDTGLRVLSSATSSAKNPDAKMEPIIIEENNLGEELFRDTAILQIEVDSGNQKWVSVDGGGVFYLSSSGDRTFEHFTKANSPLPTDSVTDIKVDEKTGKVYFVTYDGIVVYQGDVSNVTSNFGDVLVYPNPVVYANYKGNVRIRGLADKTNLRITDAAGNLVHQAIARGGYYEWDLNNQKGVRVASGIYYVLMTNADGTDKKSAKIAVVN